MASRTPSGLEGQGIRNPGAVYWNLATAALYEHIVRRGEGVLSLGGPLVVRTGDHTGRSPDDKFIVKEPTSEDKIWWGKVNRPFDEGRFDLLHQRLVAYLQGKELFVQDCYAGADPRYRIPIRVITEEAWQSLFARNLFIVRREPEQNQASEPAFSIISVPRFHAVPEVDGTKSSAFIIVNFGKRLILIGGTAYAGEIKKSVFTILNYQLPLQDVLSMHCSANVGVDGDSALFFGLSGTGKTSLSTDPMRQLIGDDEHGWSDDGIFNFEGGCYAKVIRLSPEGEPEIYACTRRFGTILENVAIDMETRRLNLDDDSLTENTRAAYPLSHIENSVPGGRGSHPRNIIMLTCDAFGVLPPIARLSPEQATYHFLTGYTAKVAGTEAGLGREPKATFSPCFGAPFMALHPTVYARLLRQKIAQHRVNCWLLNTGWIGGPFGVGSRIKLRYTRAMVHAALNASLERVETRPDRFFGLHVPVAVPEVPPELLQPRELWEDTAAYDQKAKELLEQFRRNFEPFASEVGEVVKATEPRLR